MAWRTLMIQKPAKLSLRQNQLRLKNDEGSITLPIEDIAVLILECSQISLSSSLLAKCQDKGVAVLTCDETHMPNGLLLPFHPHSRQARVAHIQQSWSEPLRKRLWQRLAQTKILNQAACLDKTVGNSAHLRGLAARVSSGDPDNIEAQAARDYWLRLFGEKFRRHQNDATNAALNYGYAVIRSFVARAQVGYGLLPAFGVHHDNQLNAFNLTDDVMEVLRPSIDFMVFQMRQDKDIWVENSNLPWRIRQVLAGAGDLRCQINGQIHTFMTACDLMAAGLVSAIEEKNAQKMPMPEFLL